MARVCLYEQVPDPRLERLTSELVRRTVLLPVFVSLSSLLCLIRMRTGRGERYCCQRSASS